MAFVIANRVQETSSTSGTGTLSLSGAVTGYQTFVSGVGSGNTTYYTIYDPTAFVWEVGIGTVTSGSPATLTRSTVLANSSGTNATLSLAGNIVNVWCDYPAERAVIQDTTLTGSAPQIKASNGLLVTAQTVTSDYTISSTDNAISPGPISVASGVTVTVSSGSVWVVV